MNALVVYDSAFGNTEEIANAIANTLGEYGRVETVSVEHTHPLELNNVDVLVLGCPTQRWRPTRAMLDLLEYIPADVLGQLTVACFDTRFDRSSKLTGSAAALMAKKLHKRGVLQLLPPESFFVEGMRGPLESGEVERASKWARFIHERAAKDKVASK
jgi:flavodoxin